MRQAFLTYPRMIARIDDLSNRLFGRINAITLMSLGRADGYYLTISCFTFLFCIYGNHNTSVDRPT